MLPQSFYTDWVSSKSREDIHPLEEALGFRSLLELQEPKYTVATIAARAGKKRSLRARTHQANRTDN